MAFKQETLKRSQPGLTGDGYFVGNYTTVTVNQIEALDYRLGHRRSRNHRSAWNSKVSFSPDTVLAT